MERFDVVIVGAGAAGMMCAIEAGKRGRSVLVLDHAKAAGEKIRISGGGRCNFTNLEAGRIDRFLSQNPRFAISALSRYKPADFIALVERHGIAWHEKTLGQLFCDGSSREIIDMLLIELRKAGARLRLSTVVDRIDPAADGFELAAAGGRIACSSLVVATGGKSIPKMGATGFGYEVARQFGVRVTETRPALVPLLAATNGTLVEQTETLLRPAIDQHVVEIRRDDTIAFRHPAFGEVVYAELMPAERKRLHRAAAEALEPVEGLGTGQRSSVAGDAVSGELARHWFGAGDSERALDAAVAACR